MTRKPHTTKEDETTPFDVFWQAYPRKVGKGDARKKFQKAIKLTDVDTMLAAIERYKRCKPDWQHFCHPATWLHGERWEDDWTEPAKPQAGGAPRSFDRAPVDPKIIRLPEDHFSKRWARGEFKAVANEGKE